jgi:hypothetical protein
VDPVQAAEAAVAAKAVDCTSQHAARLDHSP